MRRITMAFMATVAVVVLLFSYRTSTAGPPRGGGTVIATGAAPEGVVDSGEPSPQPTRKSTTARSVTVNGPAVQTRWGPVQVQVKIKSGKITDVVVLQQPAGNPRDAEINRYALPILHDKVIEAQSADVDTVSGATVTSEGYLRSLQAALDKANFRS
ncbi:FMN-binding protein [Luedemannella flava]|uniref:FMN-binding protein n=1 Tax=Luedemannella flava TaxID=349316 RepID=A0ABN2MRZ5_9ACTN